MPNQLSKGIWLILILWTSGGSYPGGFRSRKVDLLWERKGHPRNIFFQSFGVMMTILMLKQTWNSLKKGLATVDG